MGRHEGQLQLSSSLFPNSLTYFPARQLPLFKPSLSLSLTHTTHTPILLLHHLYLLYPLSLCSCCEVGGSCKPSALGRVFAARSGFLHGEFHLANPTPPTDQGPQHGAEEGSAGPRARPCNRIIVNPTSSQSASTVAAPADSDGK